MASSALPRCLSAPLHRAPASQAVGMMSRYAMREALAIIAEEGLPAVWQRHRDMHGMLWQGLGRLGLQPLVRDPSHRLAAVNAIQVQAPSPGLLQQSPPPVTLLELAVPLLPA